MTSEKKPKFYAVRNGRNPGIYNSWDEAEKQINDGFKKPEHKSFSNKKEAEKYIKGENINKRTIRFVKIETQIKNLCDQFEEQKKHIAALFDKHNALLKLIDNL